MREFVLPVMRIMLAMRFGVVVISGRSVLPRHYVLSNTKPVPNFRMAEKI